jgi:hypothetical protein
MEHKSQECNSCSHSSSSCYPVNSNLSCEDEIESSQVIEDVKLPHFVFIDKEGDEDHQQNSLLLRFFNDDNRRVSTLHVQRRKCKTHKDILCSIRSQEMMDSEYRQDNTNGRRDIRGSKVIMTVWKRSSEEPFQGALHEKQTID